jgi:hypothetical protein
MSGLGKQLRGSGIAKIINARTPFAQGGEAEDQDYSSDESSKDYSQGRRHRQAGPDEKDKSSYRDKLKKGGRAGYVQGGGAKVGEVKVKIPPYLKKGMVKMGFKKGGSAKPGLWANINKRKKLGISRPKSKSTISAKAYENMKAGFPKKK